MLEKQSLKYLELANAHKNETAYIIGKGPSLQYLTRAHIGSSYAPVIVLNDALIAVSKFDMKNKVYSLQKDGVKEFMIKPPEDVTLILQGPGYSSEYFKEHKLRYIIDPVKDLGFPYPQVMASRMAIALARYMGCNYIKLFCFDSLAKRDYRSYNPRTRKSEVTTAAQWYAASMRDVFKDLSSINHEFITPKGALT